MITGSSFITAYKNNKNTKTKKNNTKNNLNASVTFYAKDHCHHISAVFRAVNINK